MAPAALLFGTAATAATATAAAVPATAGLFGTAGSFALAQTAVTVGAGLAAASAIQQGRIAGAQGEFAKQIAARNQQALERQQAAEIEASKIEETRIARREKIVKARQRAIIGKSGVGLAGATLSVLADTAFQFSMDRNLILRRGLLRGQELRYRGQMELARGRWAFGLGREAKKLSYVKAGASILGAAGKAGWFSGGTTSPTITSGGIPTQYQPSARYGRFGAAFPS